MKKNITIKDIGNYRIEPLKGKDANATLIAGTKILDKSGMKWWLSAGTILGLYRDGDFIPHDTDIDIGVEGDHYNNCEKINKLIVAFQEDGFRLIRTMLYDNYPMQLAFIDKRNIIFDLYFFYPVFSDMINHNEGGIMMKPSRLFSSLGNMEFKENGYNCPNDIDEYLAFRYGEDWKVPKIKKGDWRKDAANLR